MILKDCNLFFFKFYAWVYKVWQVAPVDKSCLLTII